MPFFFFFKELRLRFIYTLFSFFFTFFTSYFYSDVLFYIFAKPLIKHQVVNYFISTKVSKIFIIYINLAIVSSLIFSIFVFLVQLYLFIVPGLYNSENSNLLKNIYFFLGLFILSFLMTYFFFIPLIWSFFLSFEIKSNVLNLTFYPKINEYFSSVIKLFFVFGISFQLPIIIKMALYYNLISIKTLINKRHFFILGFFIISGILSPPDIYSQLILALICILFFEITIVFYLLSDRMKKN